jgi:hypothetical protein
VLVAVIVVGGVVVIVEECAERRGLRSGGVRPGKRRGSGREVMRLGSEKVRMRERVRECCMYVLVAIVVVG